MATRSTTTRVQGRGGGGMDPHVMLLGGIYGGFWNWGRYSLHPLKKVGHSVWKYKGEMSVARSKGAVFMT